MEADLLMIPSSVFRLAACIQVLLFTACSGAGENLKKTAMNRHVCALGMSEPTLNPTDAIMNAVQDARVNLANEIRGSEIKNVSVTINDKHREVTLEKSETSFSDSRIYGIWRDKNGAMNAGKKDITYAVACIGDNGEQEAKRMLPHAFRGRLIQWILEPPVNKEQVCALGISGPTLNPEDRKQNAFQDAKNHLAATIQLHIDMIRLEVVPEGIFLFSADDEPAAWAKNLAGKRSLFKKLWVDEKGEGPAGEKGFAYALACIEIKHRAPVTVP
jgi:hypothetical protein